MKIKIFDEINYQTFPETEDMVELNITQQELDRVGIDKKFDLDTLTLVNYEAGNYMLKIEELRNKLTATDYKAIKYAEGLLTAEEYSPIKKQREEWRAEINRLEALINY